METNNYIKIVTTYIAYVIMIMVFSLLNYSAYGIMHALIFAATGLLWTVFTMWYFSMECNEGWKTLVKYMVLTIAPMIFFILLNILIIQFEPGVDTWTIANFAMGPLVFLNEPFSLFYFLYGSSINIFIFYSTNIVWILLFEVLGYFLLLGWQKYVGDR
jgi:hypothetical protein